MQLKFYFKESLLAILINPLRALLSILGVVFGVASVVTMLSIGLGAETEIEKLMSTLGIRNIHIVTKELTPTEWKRSLKSSYGLSYRDVDLLKEAYPDAQTIPIAIWNSHRVSLNKSGISSRIYGTTYDYNDVLGLRIKEGRSFTNLEESSYAPVIVIGSALADSWFTADESALGTRVRIDQSWFTIIGVLEPQKEATGNADESTSRSGSNEADAALSGQNQTGDLNIKGVELNRGIILPLASGVKRLGPLAYTGPYNRIILRVPDAYDPIQVAQSTETKLARLHQGSNVYQVISAQEIIDQKRSTTRLFSYFLLMIAFISLVVGGIGIANVMLASMVERIKEVGLRRAIGAKKRDIFVQFVAETFVICMIGGVIGGMLGLIVANFVGFITGWNVLFPWWGFLIALLIATVVGLVSGLYPAIKASKISPIEALQGTYS